MAVVRKLAFNIVIYCKIIRHLQIVNSIGYAIQSLLFQYHSLQSNTIICVCLIQVVAM